MDFDLRVMLGNISLLEEKIQEMKEIVHSMIRTEDQFLLQPGELAAQQQQQLVTADLTCLIIQLISTAGSLLPSMKNTFYPSTGQQMKNPNRFSSSNPPTGQLASLIGSGSSSCSLPNAAAFRQAKDFSSEQDMNPEYEELIKELSDNGVEGVDSVLVEEHDLKEDGGMDGENLPPDSYEVLQLEKEEILAPHTHFCSICGKGFKRDANLRMHMRGHGDEYKSPAALAKPPKDANTEPVLMKRYSCPFAGCKRNKEHKNFQPLKTILCVKNHYKRSHCEKSYICSRCHAKKFSVLADLKTHEKHCGRDKWLCSCGTTFSRKDKLFGHVALFQGHTPALPEELNVPGGRPDQGTSKEEKAKFRSTVNNFTWSSLGNDDVLGIKGLDDNGDDDFLSPMNFGSFNFAGLDEFPRLASDPAESSFSFLPSGSFENVQKNGEN